MCWQFGLSMSDHKITIMIEFTKLSYWVIGRLKMFEATKKIIDARVKVISKYNQNPKSRSKSEISDWSVGWLVTNFLAIIQRNRSHAKNLRLNVRLTTCKGEDLVCFAWARRRWCCNWMMIMMMAMAITMTTMMMMMVVIMMIMALECMMMISTAIVIIVDEKVTWSAMELACTDADFIGKKG